MQAEAEVHAYQGHADAQVQGAPQIAAEPLEANVLNAEALALLNALMPAVPAIPAVGAFADIPLWEETSINSDGFSLGFGASTIAGFSLLSSPSGSIDLDAFFAH